MESINMQISYLYLIFIYLHLSKITILSYLQDTRGFIFVILSKILFESIFPHPVYSSFCLLASEERVTRPYMLARSVSLNESCISYVSYHRYIIVTECRTSHSICFLYPSSQTGLMNRRSHYGLVFAMLTSCNNSPSWFPQYWWPAPPSRLWWKLHEKSKQISTPMEYRHIWPTTLVWDGASKFCLYIIFIVHSRIFK